MIKEAEAIQGGDETALFEELLDSYNFADPRRGDIIKGTVLEVSHDSITLDIGLKRDAIVTRKDLMRIPAHVLSKIGPGNEVNVYILQPYNADGDLIVSINKALQLEDWQIAEDLAESGDTVDATVVDSNRGGLLVSFGRLVGFLPNSHIDNLPPNASANRMEDVKKTLVGKTLTLKVIQIDVRRNRLILSERAALREARLERLNELTVGDVIDGRVVNLTHFGAFVDIGGVDGMIHISNVDHRHINHPNEVLSIGDEVKVRVDSIDAEEGRIALNRRAILPDPWDMFAANYNVGDLMNGVVTNVVDFGVFVASPSGAQGLIHTSRMATLSISHPKDMFSPGDEVLVKIVSIDLEKRHIELGIDEVPVEEQEKWMIARRERELAEAEKAEAELQEN